jgi:plasmid stabilization system protein ParE
VIVAFTREAESDLDAIAEYVARDSVTAALHLAHDLREKCLALAHAPRAGRWCPATSITASAGGRSETI